MKTRNRNLRLAFILLGVLGAVATAASLLGIPGILRAGEYCECGGDHCPGTCCKEPADYYDCCDGITYLCIGEDRCTIEALCSCDAICSLAEAALCEGAVQCDPGYCGAPNCLGLESCSSGDSPCIGTFAWCQCGGDGCTCPDQCTAGSFPCQEEVIPCTCCLYCNCPDYCRNGVPLCEFQ